MTDRPDNVEENQQLVDDVNEAFGEEFDLQDLQNPRIMQSMMEVTTGAYPPPRMLKAYRDIDEALYQSILRGADEQRSHRHQLEAEDLRHNHRMQRKGSSGQIALGLIGLVLASLIKIVPGIWGFESGWIVPVGVALLGVGGMPVATILARRFAMGPKPD